MQQIADWLNSLGLEQYAQRFAENDIDVSVLRHLTDADLEKIGVSLGHRRKMLAAIAELHGAAPSKPEPVRVVEPKPQDAAERRQVTVMFSDLVGSTALSTRMDPEDLREVISAYQKSVTETVGRFGGFVAKYMGDGVLVYFGYPQAHEDDPERAVRAGLELVAAISALKSSVPLQTLVGIATGLVVIGDLIGSGVSQEQAIVGETPNLAARLQAIAEPNAVVIAENTRKLLGNLFELEDLGTKDLKGIAGSVRAWAAVRPASVESRFEALHAGGLTALVGREEELEILLRRWSRAKSGQGQVVLLSGEAGIGKSRLTAALLEAVASEPHTRLRHFCSPQHTDSALYPTIGHIERASGFTRNDTLQAKLDKLDLLLAQTSTSAQDAALLAELLSLPNDGRYPALELTPQQRRQRTLEALIAQIVALSRKNPLLTIFEDAHWSDPTSLELFGRIVDRTPNLRLLLIVTFRPEFEPPWIGRPHVTALTINRLAEREVGAMIDRVIGNKPLTASVRQDIIERTDGIPLFVEEMTKAVLEAGAEGAAERTAAGRRLMGVSLASMGELVQARAHYDQALPLYDPVAHRPLAAHFTADIRVAILNFRTWALWLLGYPDAALADANQALIEAREVGLASTLMPALNNLLLTRIFRGDYETAIAEAKELSSLAEEKNASQWKAAGMLHQGCVLTLAGDASRAVEMLTSAIAAWRSTGARLWLPLWFSYSGKACADLGRFDDAWHCIGEATTLVETTKERWFQAELHRISGELSQRSQQPDEAKAEASFERALAVARQQQAKSWELRAAMSLARLWRDQGKSHEARELLAPVYGWFTEGFDTRDLKEAKALLEELAL